MAERTRKILNAIVSALPDGLRSKYWEVACNTHPWMDVGYEPGFGRFYSPREIVLQIWVQMDDDSRRYLKTKKAGDMIMYHHGWGTTVRNHFGLWRPTNPYTDFASEDGLHPDDLSGKILNAVWFLVAKNATPAQAFSYAGL